MLVFILVIGRWLLPRGNVPQSEISLLLFAYFGTGSDIMELLVLFEEDYVIQEDAVVYATLIIWTVSLFQFTLTVSALSKANEKCLCTTTELWGVLIVIFMQDGPFLALRLYVIIKNQALSYSILFFTLKNGLMLMLQFFRLYTLVCGPPEAEETDSEPEKNDGKTAQSELNDKSDDNDKDIPDVVTRNSDSDTNALPVANKPTAINSTENYSDQYSTVQSKISLFGSKKSKAT